MPTSPNDRKYNGTTHEWIMSSGSTPKMGITLYRALQIGTANAVELAPKNTSVGKTDEIGKITGAYATHHIISMIEGTVPDRNDILSDGIAAHPEYVTSDPYGLGSTGGWLFSLNITGTDPRDGMMTAAEYDADYPLPNTGMADTPNAPMGT